MVTKILFFSSFIAIFYLVCELYEFYKDNEDKYFDDLFNLKNRDNSAYNIEYKKELKLGKLYLFLIFIFGIIIINTSW